MNRIAASLVGADPSEDNATATSLAALQLLHVSSKLASWVHSESHTSLPSDLQHGPVLLLHGAAENADSPHISSRLLDDTLVFLTYGVNYLSDHGDRAQLLDRLEDARTQRLAGRANLHAYALRIQTQFRCQRFGTHRLASLEFATSESLIPEVQEEMSSSSPNSSDLVITAAVTVDNEELQSQIDKYASELSARVEARKREAELQRQRQQREHREQEDLKKKQFYQKRRRYENACRRWNYFSGRLLRLHRDENHQEIQSRVEARRRTILPTDQQPVIAWSSTLKRASGSSLSSRQVVSTTPSARQLAKKRSKPSFRRIASSSLMKNALHRNFIRQFVAKVIARGLSRVLCESNMSVEGSSGSAKAAPTEAKPSQQEQSQQQQQPERVLRIGILLCDVHFGAKYMSLYQRFLERAARDQGFASIEWQLFDCTKSQFPTRALQRVLHGFLVAGGPNNGANHAQEAAGTESRPDNSESTTSSNDNDDRHGNAGTAERPKSVGPWRKNLQKLLRQIYSDKRAIICGLGLGHVVLAEALGAKCGHNDWEDGWSVLDPKLFDAKVLDRPPGGSHGSHEASERSRPISKYVAIKYLHGEFVQSMDFAPRGMRVWRSLDQRFVSCFKDKWVLSFDGFPECGTFVFETMGELYDREKAAAAIGHQQTAKATISRRDSIAEDDDTCEVVPTSRFGFMPTPSKPPQRQQPPAAVAGDRGPPTPARRVGVIDTVLTLEEKKKLLDVTDISQAVAYALVGHFQTAIMPQFNAAAGANGAAEGSSTSLRTATTEIAAVVNPVDCIDIEESVRVLAATTGHDEGGRVTSICLRVRSTLDGHLVVLGAQLDAFVRNHERKVRESRRPSLLSSPHSNVLMSKNSRVEEEATAALLLSLHTLRDRKLGLIDDAASSLSSSQGSNNSVGGSGSNKQRMVINLPIQLPTLSMSSSSASPFDAAGISNNSTTTAIGNEAMSSINDTAAARASSSRKRPLQVVKRVKNSAMGVLTLSEALTRFQIELTNASCARAIAASYSDKRRQMKAPPSVIIQFPDEEICSHSSNSTQSPFQVQRKSPDKLRLLWVRLVAALRVSEVSDDRVCLLSRQTSVLDFFRKRQPLWTLIKDCRRSASLPPRHDVRRVSWYARYADILLFDQEMLLNNSAKENEALFQQAKYYGLKVFVAREDKTAAENGDSSKNSSSSTSSTRSLDDNRTRSSKRLTKATSPQKHHPHRASTFSGAGIFAKAAAGKERAMEKDLQIVEILLLQLTGVDGVLTPTPEIAIEATQKLLSKSPTMNQVEQLFRTWQSKGSGKNAVVVALPKRPSLRRSGSAGNMDDLLDEENEDYMGEAHERDDEMFLDDKEIALEMARQYAEHGVRRPPSSTYVPLRPLQPKRGDQVLGAQQHHRQSSFPFGSAGAGASNSEAARSQLRSIGTFRNAFQRSQTVRSPPHLEGTHMQQTLDDDRVVMRPPEVTLSSTSLSNSSMLLQKPLKVSMQSPRVRRLNQAPAVTNSAG